MSFARNSRAKMISMSEIDRLSNNIPEIDKDNKALLLAARFLNASHAEPPTEEIPAKEAKGSKAAPKGGGIPNIQSDPNRAAPRIKAQGQADAAVSVERLRAARDVLTMGQVRERSGCG